MAFTMSAWQHALDMSMLRLLKFEFLSNSGLLRQVFNVNNGIDANLLITRTLECDHDNSHNPRQQSSPYGLVSFCRTLSAIVSGVV